MSYLLGIAGGFVLGVAIAGFFNERRVRQIREDAREFIEADSKRRYGA